MRQLIQRSLLMDFGVAPALQRHEHGGVVAAGTDGVGVIFAVGYRTSLHRGQCQWLGVGEFSESFKHLAVLRERCNRLCIGIAQHALADLQGLLRGRACKVGAAKAQVRRRDAVEDDGLRQRAVLEFGRCRGGRLVEGFATATSRAMVRGRPSRSCRG